MKTARAGVERWPTLVAFAIAFLGCAGSAAAQRIGDGSGQRDLAGTELEAYLRYARLEPGDAPLQWSVRPFSEVERLAVLRLKSANPWHQRVAIAAGDQGAFRFAVLPPSVGVVVNSGFPYDAGDNGPVWAGRGLTFAAEAGVFAKAGPLSLRLQPIFFRAENAGFDVGTRGCPPNCVLDQGRGADYVVRFGNTPYQQLDPGASTVRLDLFHLTAGASTANEIWGPMEKYPFLLGPNAAGFAHLFFGTSQPLNVLVGHVSTRVLYGRLDQSRYSTVTGSKYYSLPDEPGRVRFASGLLVDFQPAGVSGLDLGFGRFIQSVWPRTGIPRSFLRKPFRAFLKADLPAGFDKTLAGLDNELASGFFRWAFPQSGFEVYGEYGREDHSYDARDLAQEPDHQRSYGLGIRKAIERSDSLLSGFRAELINFQEPALALTGRGEGSIYVHGTIRQGQTNRGQLLGAPVGVRVAAGSTVAYDRYFPSGHWAVKWERTVRQETDSSTDVLQAIGFERTRFGKRLDVRWEVALMRDLNRNFSGDATNLNLAVTLSRPAHD